MRYLFTLIFSLLLLTPANNLYARQSNWQGNEKVAAIFAQAQVNGTFVLYDVTQGTYTGYNLKRAHTKYVPASTFKIPNTLIGLEVGAVKDVDEVLFYQGSTEDFLSSWKTSSSLREAIKVSNLPIYQTLANRIGLPQMQAQLSKMGYGNGQAGQKLDTFWLEGPLVISAFEQVDFLARLAQQQLPFAKSNQLAVREIIATERGADWTLYAKTGAATAYQSYLGWWVGWVEKDGQVYAFALNMDMQNFDSDLSKRIEIGKQSLAALGII